MAQPTTYTVLDALILCGIPHPMPAFHGASPAERIATNLFHDNFTTCRDCENSDIDAAFKEYVALTVAQGQIRIGPGPKEKVKAFIQWVRDQFLLDLDPASVPFPVQDTSMYLRHSKTMEHFQAKAKRMAELAKPQLFRSNMKWEDWYPSFANLLRHQPGRDGVPLSYVIRDRDQPDHTPKDTYLDCLMAAAPHFGESFREDADTVHTLITKYIAGNADAEAKIQERHDQKWNGRKDIQALRAHYKGVGANSLDIRRADKILQELHYGGEHRPHMWWAEFEKQLTSAFHYYHKHEEREVYSNAMKVRILLRKVHADFLVAHKAAIEKDIGEPNNTVTYESALTTFRNAVNAKFPPQLTPQRVRRIQETATARSTSGGRGRGRNTRNYKGCGRGRGHGNANHSGVKRQREDSTYEMLDDGTFLEIHPSFSYPDATWRMIPYATRKRLMEQRAALRARNNPQCSVQQADQAAHDEISQLSQSLSQTPSQASPTPVAAIQVQQTDRSQQGSHVSWQTIMGGKKEQESKHRLGALRSTRSVSQSTRSPTIGQEPRPNISARNETDTNADTCCLGTNFRILHYTGRVADMLPYDKSYPAVQGVPIVTGVTAWDEPSTGTTYLLVIHEARPLLRDALGPQSH